MKTMAKRDRLPDKRKLSGTRVLAKCEVEFKKEDPFGRWDPVKRGYIVLNIRGGCLYLGEYFDEENIEKLFPCNGNGVFLKLTLFVQDKPVVVLKNMKVTFQRFRKEINREGIVFRFVDITNRQLDILDKVTNCLPAVGADEAASVPFDDFMAVDRSHNFKVLT